MKKNVNQAEIERRIALRFCYIVLSVLGMSAVRQFDKAFHIPIAAVWMTRGLALVAFLLLVYWLLAFLPLADKKE